MALNRFDCTVENAGEPPQSDPGRRPRDAAETDAGDLSTIKYYCSSIAKCTRPARIAQPDTPGKTASKSTWSRTRRRGLERLMEAGGIRDQACGLGARNTCGWKPRWRSNGHEIDASISPLEADLADRQARQGEFHRRDVLVKQKENGVRRKLVDSRCAARDRAGRIRGIPHGAAADG